MIRNGVSFGRKSRGMLIAPDSGAAPGGKNSSAFLRVHTHITTHHWNNACIILGPRAYNAAERAKQSAALRYHT